MRITVDTTPTWTGLVDTIGYTLYDGQDIYQARTTTGITEIPVGSGIYGVAIADDILAGKWVVWDTDNGSPIYASESFPADLAGYAGNPSGGGTPGGVTIARSIYNLASRARVLYPKAGDVALYREFIQEAFFLFVHRVGGVYSRSWDIPLTDDNPEYALPADFRCMHQSGVELLLDDVVVGKLSFTNYGAVRDERAGISTIYGVPTRYYYPDDSHIGVHPYPSLGGDYALRVKYDGEVPTDLSMYDGLPISPLYERALLAYAVACAARTQGDYDREKMEMGTWERLVGIRKTAGMQRTNNPARVVPFGAKGSEI